MLKTCMKSKQILLQWKQCSNTSAVVEGIGVGKALVGMEEEGGRERGGKREAKTKSGQGVCGSPVRCCMYLIGQGCDAQPYPAATDGGGGRGDGGDRLLTARALACRPQARHGARHGAGRALGRQARHLVHRCKQAVHRLALKVPGDNMLVIIFITHH
jgi:hypothetical protein